MASFESALASIPGYGGFLAKKQMNERQGMSELQQLGGSMGILAKIQAQQQEREFRGALGALGPNPTQESLATLAAKYAPAKDILTSQTASLDRKEAAAGRAETAQANRDAMLERATMQVQANMEAARQRGVDAENLKRMEIASREHLTRLAAQLRPAPQPRAPVAVMGDDGKPVLVDPRDAIGKTPGSAGVEKLLPPHLQKQLSENAELADATQRFKTTFKDEFAGKTITGELSNIKGRYLGDDTGQTQWWQDYELHQSQVRNKLFGSALTAPEIEAWNKSAINPRMESKQVRANLERRDAIEKRAIDRLIKGAAAGRYSKDQIEAFTGRAVSDDAPKRRASDSAQVLKFDAQGNPIQ